MLFGPSQSMKKANICFACVALVIWSSEYADFALSVKVLRKPGFKKTIHLNFNVGTSCLYHLVLNTKNQDKHRSLKIFIVFRKALQ